MTDRVAKALLPERARSTLAAGVSVLATVVLTLATAAVVEVSPADATVIVMLLYLVVYPVATMAAFSQAPHATIRAWAQGSERGTFAQRYLWGTAPGPGASIFIAVLALLVSLVWLPGTGSSLPGGVRVGVGLALVVVAWISVVISFTVAYCADNLLAEQGPAVHGLVFPSEPDPLWIDYVYFAVGVMTTFGTTDVNVESREMRRTVTVHAIVAFVFNTVIVATLVSTLASV